LAFTRFLSGKPLESLDGVALNSSGFPKQLEFMQDHLKSVENDSITYYNVLRVYNTLFSMGRAFHLPAVLKSDTITDP